MKKDNNKEKEPMFENPIFERIVRIINSSITAGEVQALEKKLGFNKTILKLLETENENKQLALLLISEISADYFKQFIHLQNDKSIVKTAILKNYLIYYSISDQLKKDKEIWETVVESMVRDWRNFFEIEKFIEENFLKDKQILYKKYEHTLELSNRVILNDLSKQILILKQTNKAFYDILIKLWFVVKNFSKLEISKSLVFDITNKILLDEEYIKLQENDKLLYKQSYLEKIFRISIKWIHKDIKYIFDILLELIQINESKSKLKHQEKLDKEQEANDDDTKTEKDEDSKIDQKEQEFNELLEYSYLDSYVQKVDGWYNIDTLAWKKLFLADEQKDKFTSKSLTNYVKFYNTLTYLWLNFLWDKHSYDFTILCNNKFWFNHIYWAWITEVKLLSVLNLIWKNVWIPETEFYVDENESFSEDWQKIQKREKKLSCFRDLWEANLAFLDIKSTWKINSVMYSDNSAFWNWAIENKLRENDCIDRKKHNLNITEWK